MRWRNRHFQQECWVSGKACCLAIEAHAIVDAISWCRDWRVLWVCWETGKMIWMERKYADRNPRQLIAGEESHGSPFEGLLPPCEAHAECKSQPAQHTQLLGARTGSCTTDRSLANNATIINGVSKETNLSAKARASKVPVSNGRCAGGGPNR